MIKKPAIIQVTERQFHAMLLPAIRYREALCLHNDFDRLRKLCRGYSPTELEYRRIIPGPISPEENAFLRRLQRVDERRLAIVVSFEKSVPHLFDGHVTHVKVV